MSEEGTKKMLAVPTIVISEKEKQASHEMWRICQTRQTELRNAKLENSVCLTNFMRNYLFLSYKSIVHF